VLANRLGSVLQCARNAVHFFALLVLIQLRQGPCALPRRTCKVGGLSQLDRPHEHLSLGPGHHLAHHFAAADLAVFAMPFQTRRSPVPVWPFVW
jgi:hypothetical protein